MPIGIVVTPMQETVAPEVQFATGMFVANSVEPSNDRLLETTVTEDPDAWIKEVIPEAEVPPGCTLIPDSAFTSTSECPDPAFFVSFDEGRLGVTLEGLLEEFITRRFPRLARFLSTRLHRGIQEALPQGDGGSIDDVLRQYRSAVTTDVKQERARIRHLRTSRGLPPTTSFLPPIPSTPIKERRFDIFDRSLNLDKGLDVDCVPAQSALQTSDSSSQIAHRLYVESADRPDENRQAAAKSGWETRRRNQTKLEQQAATAKRSAAARKGHRARTVSGQLRRRELDIDRFKKVPAKPTVRKRK